MSPWNIVAALAAAVMLEGAQGAIAQESGFVSHSELSVMGGAQALDQNDTALPDHFVNVPVVGALAYHFSPNLAAEGEFAWVIPVKQSVDLGASGTQDRKTPDVLSYMANARVSWPLSGWTPYLTGGLGAVTFLSTTEQDRVPQLNSSQTAFAIDLGAGVMVGVNAHWGLRGDFRSLAAFPSKDAPGLSSSGTADTIWMERVTAGLAYRF